MSLHIPDEPQIRIQVVIQSQVSYKNVLLPNLNVVTLHCKKTRQERVPNKSRTNPEGYTNGGFKRLLGEGFADFLSYLDTKVGKA